MSKAKWLRSFSSTTMSSRLHIESHVEQALANGEPVVALESTIVAHGMPYPQNLQVAQEVESILRRQGVVPATIAVRDGVCQVGLSSEELADLAKAGPDGRATKCSTRELSILMAKAAVSAPHSQIQWGATTVASTMTLAHRAGIATFVTGGIGGVHRNGHVSMDISADLTELSRTPVLVISAGIKSILDIERTLEVLETLGVPAVSYGTNEFPAFFSPHSGVASPARMDSASEVAEAYWAARELGLSHGMIVAVPNDDPAGDNVERAIQQALKVAEAQGIKGQAMTPFILKEVARQTGGDSLRSNMALVRNNAHVGAEIAIEIARKKAGSTFMFKTPPVMRSKVVVIGGVVMDMVAKPEEGGELLSGTSNPGTCTESDGGVGRNVAEVLGRLGSKPLLYSAVGDDSRGRALLATLEQECDVLCELQIVEEANTATYLAVLNGAADLHTAVADMSVLSQVQPPPDDVLKAAEILVMDANPPLAVLKEAARCAMRNSVKVAFEPTSVPKARAVAQDTELLACLTYAFPNTDELMAMADVLPEGASEVGKSPIDDLDILRIAASKVLSQMKRDEAYLVVTMGERGVLVASRSPNVEPHLHHYPSKQGVVVKNTTGAGDSFCGAFIHAILEGSTIDHAVTHGIEAAVLSLQCSERAISPKLSRLKIKR